MRRSAVLGGSAHALLAIEDVEVTHAVTPVLRGVSLRVDREEAVALVGTNGSGKSTLVGAVAGLYRLTAGRIWLAGQDVTRTRPDVRARRGLVVIRAGRGVFPDLTVAQNLELQRHAVTGRPRQVADVLEVFPALGARLSLLAGQLSGGEQQQLALAKAFLREPSVLMIDELSLGLSTEVRAAVIEALRILRQRGAALLIVDQDVQVAAAICDRAVFLEQGSVGFDGPMQDLLGREDLLRSVLLIGAGR